MIKQVDAKRNVFLDTQVVVSNNYEFSNNNLARIAHLIQEDRLSFFFTQITVEEIEGNIIDAVKEAEKAIKNRAFRRSVSILYNCQSPSFRCMFEGFNSEVTTAQLIGQFEKYLEDCRTTVLTFHGISIDKVFKNYFSKLPPFEEGRKKDEFPDAFAIAALELGSTPLNRGKG